MPVLGHAFVGMATGMSLRPPQRATPRGAATWLPVMVGLAYLPDIANQLAQLAGLGNARVPAHSILFAVLASAAIAPLWSRWTGFSARRAFSLSLLSILIHDVLDLLQATDRAPLWPFSQRRIGLEHEIIPLSVGREAAAFAGLFLVFLLVRLTWFRRAAVFAAETSEKVAWRTAARRWTIAGHAAVAMILVLASATHYLRGAREQELARAWELVMQTRFRDGIAAAERAGRWPSTCKPGRIDYLKAEAFLDLKDYARSEAHYRRAVDADPDYFWSLADLAALIASDPRLPPAVRRRQVEPYVARLRHDFANHPDLPRILRKLGPVPGDSSAAGNGAPGGA